MSSPPLFPLMGSNVEIVHYMGFPFYIDFPIAMCRKAHRSRELKEPEQLD